MSDPLRPYKATNSKIKLEESDDNIKAYGIDERIPSITSDSFHLAKIIVFGDMALRNKIMRLLNATISKR